MDTDEFKQMMESKFGSTVDAQAAFAKFDVNNDGVLDKEEMRAVQLELEQQSAMRGGSGGQGVRSEVLEAQLERIETFVVAVHGSCSALHEEMAQVSSKAWRRFAQVEDSSLRFLLLSFFNFVLVVVQLLDDMCHTCRRRMQPVSTVSCVSCSL